jgi:hypothetical protein
VPRRDHDPMVIHTPIVVDIRGCKQSSLVYFRTTTRVIGGLRICRAHRSTRTGADGLLGKTTRCALSPALPSVSPPPRTRSASMLPTFAANEHRPSPAHGLRAQGVPGPSAYRLLLGARPPASKTDTGRPNEPARSAYRNLTRTSKPRLAPLQPTHAGATIAALQRTIGPTKHEIACR